MATFDPRTGQVIPTPGLDIQAQLGAPQLGGAGGLPPQATGPNIQPQQPFVPPTGLIGAEQALQGGLQGSLAGLQTGIGGARRDVRGQLAQGRAGLGRLNQFVGAGQQSQQLQAALSGALGPDAQRQAFADFTASPGQQFLQQRGEQAVLRNASALGGLGGGRVQQELQRQGIGFAQQDFANQFDRLGQLTGQGLTAAGQSAGLGAQLAGQGAGLLGNLGLQGGLQASRLAAQTGRDLAFGRTRAGEQIAGGISGTTSALSNLANQQGIGVSGLLGETGGNLAGLLAGTAQEQAAGQQALAQLLASGALTQSGQAAGLPGIPGIQETQGILARLEKTAAGAAGAIAASDERLKENIQPVGITEGGNTIYTWDWNDEGKRIAGNDPTIGVIAQEVPYASLMGPDGYLMVDYSRVI